MTKFYSQKVWNCHLFLRMINSHWQMTCNFKKADDRVINNWLMFIAYNEVSFLSFAVTKGSFRKVGATYSTVASNGSR